MKSKNKFTLIELMICVLILGLMVGLASLKLDSMLPGARLEAEARNLANMITYLYETSVTNGRFYSIRYNAEEHTYEVIELWQREDDPLGLDTLEAPPSASKIKLPEGIIFKEINDDYDQSIPGSGYEMEIRFNPSGYVSPHRVHLEDKEMGREITLEVTFLTGQVIFHEGYYEPKQKLSQVEEIR